MDSETPLEEKYRRWIELNLRGNCKVDTHGSLCLLPNLVPVHVLPEVTQETHAIDSSAYEMSERIVKRLAGTGHASLPQEVGGHELFHA